MITISAFRWVPDFAKGQVRDLRVRWALEEAVGQLAAWQHVERPGAPDLWVAVNVSARQLRDPDLVAFVRQLLVDAGVEPHQLRVEITETVMLEDAESVTEALLDLVTAIDRQEHSEAVSVPAFTDEGVLIEAKMTLDASSELVVVPVEQSVDDEAATEDDAAPAEEAAVKAPAKKAAAKAKAAGVYKGRRENTARNEGIAAMLLAGSSWLQIQEAMGCSRGTIAKVRQRLNSAAAEGA